MNQSRAVPSPSLKKPTLKKSDPKPTSSTFSKDLMYQSRADIIKILYSDSPYFLHSRKMFSILIL